MVEILDGKILATDNTRGHQRSTDVLWSDGTPVPAHIIDNSSSFEFVLVDVGPGGSRSLRVVTDDPATHAPSGKPSEIVVVGSKIKEVVKSVKGTDQDDILYVRAEAQWPGLELDGGGGFDTYIVRSPEPGEPEVVGEKIPAHYIQEVTCDCSQNRITVVLADFRGEFETQFDPNLGSRFYNPETGRTQIIQFVDRDGNPVEPDGVAIFSSDEFDAG